MTALADATDPRFTDGQRAQLARFEAAEVPAEVVEAGDVVERVAVAIVTEAYDARAWAELDDSARAAFTRYARAAIAAMPR